MKSLLLIVPLVLLAACAPDPAEDGGDNRANAAAAVPPGPMLGEVDLSAPLRLGDEAGEWSLVLAPGRIMFEPRGGAPVPFYPRSPVLAGKTARYTTETPDGETVEIRLDATPCGPESARAPLTAQLQIGSRRYQGCARPLPIAQIQYDMYNEAMEVPYNAAVENAVARP
jgi:uncharacterized membrane protein